MRSYWDFIVSTACFWCSHFASPRSRQVGPEAGSLSDSPVESPSADSDGSNYSSRSLMELLSEKSGLSHDKMVLSSTAPRLDKFWTERAHKDLAEFRLAPNLLTAFENHPELGTLTLGRLIAMRPTSVIYEIRERPELVIKYQVICNERNDHPLIYDFIFLREAAEIGLSPTPKFLSPASAMLVGPTKKTLFDMQPPIRKECVANGGAVRYLVLERVGPCLDADIKGKRLSLTEAFEIGIRVMRMLERLHTEKEIIHGDIHIGNICYPLEGDRDRLYLIDFGLAEFADSETDEPARGPFEYFHDALTPWQLLGHGCYRRDDIYKAIYMVAVMINGDEPMYSLAKGMNARQLHAWKVSAAIFETPAVNPLGSISDIPESKKEAIRSIFRSLIDAVMELNSVRTPIDYDRYVALMHAVIKNLLDQVPNVHEIHATPPLAAIKAALVAARALVT